ncbi:MAG: CPBP family intramembrane metalloprotease [Bacteroidetes bacterium]|nr:CPBP family intramembrane metalloprotease [Bacteroidota bacterium]
MSDSEIQNESGIFQTAETRYRPAKFAIWSLVGLFFLYQLVGGGLTMLIIGGAITEENVTLARLVTMISQFLFLLVPTVLLAKRQHGNISEVFRWRIPSFTEAFLAVVGMIALMQIGEFYLYFQNMIPLPESIAPFMETMKRVIEETFKILIVAHSVPELLFVMTVAALTPAICEELMFRGLIQKNFTISGGNVKGFILAGTIFGLYHMNPFWLIPLMALGVYFSFIQYRSRTLILPIIVHFMNNAAATVSVYVFGNADSSTPTMFMGEQSEPAVSTVLGTGIFFSIIFFLVIVQYIKVTENVLHPARVNEQTH